MGNEASYRRWDELGPLVEKAEGLTGNQLASFCTEHCGDDAELESLLRGLLRDTGDRDQRLRDSISQVADQASRHQSST